MCEDYEPETYTLEPDERDDPGNWDMRKGVELPDELKEREGKE